MNRPLQRKPDGAYKRIHGHAVVEVETYKGWAIRYHWGGFVGSKPSMTMPGNDIITDTFPRSCEVEGGNGKRYRISGKLKVKRAIDAFEEKYPE